MRTVRFTQLVEKSGTPQVHVTLVARDRDRALKRAQREHRVLSVHQENKGNASDYGLVGLPQDHQGEILIFPKSLRAFADRRVIGIKYDLVEQPALAPARPATRFTRFSPTAPKSKAATASINDASSNEPRARASTKRRSKAKRSKAKAPARSNKSKPARAPAPVDLASVLREVERATRELKSGKDVAAYERLQRLLENARS